MSITTNPTSTPVDENPGGEWLDDLHLTHYWDCSGQACDSTTLSPWDDEKWVCPIGYGPQDPGDFGGAIYGEKMWLTGAANDDLSDMLGEDDGCCGEDRGRGGCGKCLLLQNPESIQPAWTAIVMKKNRCPPESTGCGPGSAHFDVAVPGYEDLEYSLANVCSLRPNTGFDTREQSETLGKWYKSCANTAECVGLCDSLPSAYQKGCRLFSSWGWEGESKNR